VYAYSLPAAGGCPVSGFLLDRAVGIRIGDGSGQRKDRPVLEVRQPMHALVDAADLGPISSCLRPAPAVRLL
jgi:hypothetical protein